MAEDRVRITLVRHGESVANRTQRWQGQGDSELSALGRAQAQAVCARLRGRKFDLIVASDLERASATARALGRRFERDPSFREFDIGAWEGLTREQVAEHFGEELRRLEAGEDVALGGGENYASFSARVDAALQRVRARLGPNEHALVFCHGGVIGTLVSGALGLRGARELPFARVFNTSITEFSFASDGRVTLHVFNDSLHLAELDLFPHPTEMRSSLALVCETAPHAAFGLFGAHYHVEDPGHDLSLAPIDELSLLRLFESVRARHPEHRIALSAASPRIHGWAGEALWSARDALERIGAPARGSVCHFGLSTGRPMLIDYGVAV